MSALGIHKSVTVVVSADPPTSEPAVGVYLGSPAAAADPGCIATVDAALGRLQLIVPVVDDLTDFSAQVPPGLQPLNGWRWFGPDAPRRLARLLLEELGIEERQRSVFISHKREDGLLAAEQLYERLVKSSFRPFIDRFDIRPGADVQAMIADALEAHAFLLLLETPLAHTSEWVYDEVEYALSHAMALHIITWPGNPTEVPGSGRLRRQHLQGTDLATAKGYQILTDGALDAAFSEIEGAHAVGLVRRRRNLLRSVEDAAVARGLRCTPLQSWRLLVEGPNRREVVAVSPRLPDVDDLRQLDMLRVGTRPNPPPGVLVHAARVLRDDRRNLLGWATGDRPLTLVPENAVGGYW
jgi:hypothetical protein